MDYVPDSVNTMLTILMLFLIVAYGSPEQPRIIKGQEAKQGDFPFVVLLEVIYDMSEGLCTGSIIHEDWILTAAHCSENSKNITVYAALVNMKSTESSGVQKRVVKNYYNYPGSINRWNLNGHNIIYDYSLLRLDSSLDINNDTVKVLELDDTYWEPGSGRTCTAVGFGQRGDDPTSFGILYFIEIEAFHGFGACPCLTKKRKIAATICLVTNASHKSICHGDSGGPLICDKRQVGVASYVGFDVCNLFSTKAVSKVKCGAEGMLSMYNYVSPILDWIRMHVGGSSPP